MKNKEELRRILKRINGKGYKAYKDTTGSYDFSDYVFIIDHVQGDPFALPSRVRVRVSLKRSAIPLEIFHTKSREIALRDYLARQFSKSVGKYSKGVRGVGKSGLLSIDTPGQEVLEISAVSVDNESIEVRFTLGLPAFGRSVAGKEAETIIFAEIPRIVLDSLFYENIDNDSMSKHVKTVEDADFIRSELKTLGLKAFVPDGAILPRASGADNCPLLSKHVVQFTSPDSLRVEINLPNAGKITGMGIPAGITLIAGGGYHGKSTLLKALELGVYNHIPGDGREFTVTVANAVKIRSEDGRRVSNVDVSPFINNLPLGLDTTSFSTEDASGSTSQAANILEAVEIGTDLLLIDEDTSATNFMIRDRRMQELVSKDKEPVTPFIDKMRQLRDEFGVSVVLVMGGSGDYFDVADIVICMDEYLSVDVTEKAKEIAGKYKNGRKAEGGPDFGALKKRFPVKSGFDPSRGKSDAKIVARGLKSIDFGNYNIDLGAVEQIVDSSQTRAIGMAIYYALNKYINGARSLGEIIQLVMRDISDHGLDILTKFPTGDMATFRGQELACAINRLRTLKIS